VRRVRRPADGKNASTATATHWRAEADSLYLDMDAEAVDELLWRLAEVRMRMLPAQKRN
jgi:outer membrane lipopolysaccharide assembly protein LptE/RlpB